MTTTFSTARAAAVFIVICTALIGMTSRVAYLQTYGREKTIRSAERQQHQVETLAARRGSVFSAEGTLMAGTVQERDLFVDPKFMADYYTADDHKYEEYFKNIDGLAQLLDCKPAELAAVLSDHSNSRYIKVAEGLKEKVVLAIQKMNLPGVGFSPTNVREYPMGPIAAHLLGGTGKDGHGLEGLELRFDQQLAGHDGWKRTLKDARRHPIAVAADDYRPAEHGQHLILTIDANIQMIAEQELNSTCNTFKAERGEVIVMDPRTGDVLALANWPTFNPQNLEDSTPEIRTNHALVSPYEPGSTIKPFIAGPALSQNITKPEEVFKTGGSHWSTYYGRKITDVHNGYPQLAFWDVLVKSSNIGMSMLGERMGNPKLHAALTGFGFGSRTGIELPGEDPGRVNPLTKWNKYSTESVAQGYELMVTPLQLARAFCAYANGGRLVKPRIVKGVLDANGNLVEQESQADFKLYPQVINPTTAMTVRRILCDVPIRGTASKACARIWNIFGKTGTAHISEGPGKGYSPTLFNSSFIAGCPAENPRLVVAFIIHKPATEAHYGGAVAAPGACKLMERAMAYLQVPPSPDLQPPPPDIAKVLWQYNERVYARPKTQAAMR